MKASHTASVIPAKAKFAIRNPPPALKSSCGERIGNAINSIDEKQPTRRAIEKNGFISGRNIISEYAAPTHAEMSIRQLRVGAFTNSPAAESIKKLTSRFIISSISTYITLFIPSLPNRYD